MMWRPVAKFMWVALGCYIPLTRVLTFFLGRFQITLARLRTCRYQWTFDSRWSLDDAERR